MPSEASPAGSCDLLVFDAHPDDAELCCGGLLLKSQEQGWTTAVADLTRGEMGTRGTPEIRASEAEAAARVLGLTKRLNLRLPDGGIRDTDENRQAIVRVVRELRPKILVAPPRDDHHPDHMATAELVRHSFYLCGVRKYPPDLPPWRPRALLHHMGTRPLKPDLVIDVTAVIQRRMEAVRCYRSQFSQPQNGEFPLRIAAQRFIDSIEATLMYFGSLIGVQYGEPYTIETPLPVENLVGLFANEPWKDR